MKRLFLTGVLMVLLSVPGSYWINSSNADETGPMIAMMGGGGMGGGSMGGTGGGGIGGMMGGHGYGGSENHRGGTGYDQGRERNQDPFPERYQDDHYRSNTPYRQQEQEKRSEVPHRQHREPSP